MLHTEISHSKLQRSGVIYGRMTLPLRILNGTRNVRKRTGQKVVIDFQIWILVQKNLRNNNKKDRITLNQRVNGNISCILTSWTYSLTIFPIIEKMLKIKKNQKGDQYLSAENKIK